jgi:hypothetical protein
MHPATKVPQESPKMSEREARRRQRQSEQDSTPEARERQRAILAAYIAEPEAAAELGVDKRTLRKWRRAGQGPPGWLKIGRCFYYRIETIEAWLRDREAKPLRKGRVAQRASI